MQYNYSPINFSQKMFMVEHIINEQSHFVAQAKKFMELER
jgi:hypothetical protein